MKKFISLLILLSSVVCNAQLSGLGNVPLTPPAGIGINKIMLYSSNSITTISDINSIGNTMTKGQFLIFGPGVYIATNNIILPVDGGIVGAGKNVTILINKFTNGIPAPLITLADNSVVSDLTITNYYGDPDINGIPSSCVGIHRNSGTRGYTNALLNNLILWGGSDTFYNRHTNLCQSVSQNCDFHGLWDIVTAFEGTNDQSFFNCTFTNIATITHANASDVWVSSFDSKSIVTFVDCILYSTRNTSYIISFLDAPYVSGSFLYMKGCRLYNPDADATPATSAYIYFADSRVPALLENTELNPRQVGEPDDGAPDLSYGTNFVSSIVFGGDTPNGIGPRLYKETDGKVTSDNSFSAPLLFSTNSVIYPSAAKVAIAAGNIGFLWNSNKVLYWVTTTKTNLVSNGN